MALLLTFAIFFALFAALLEGDAKTQRHTHLRQRARTITH